MIPEELRLRRGKILVNNSTWQSCPVHETLKTLFSEFYPVDGCTAIIKEGKEFTMYKGISEKFRTLADGMEAPRYQVIFVWSEGKTKVEFREEK